MKHSLIDTRYPKKAKDLTGMQFGDWTVLGFSHRVLCPDNPTASNYYWKCECVCGKEQSIAASNLKSDRIGGCGCAVARRGDLTGKRFGKWTVVGFSRKERKDYKNSYTYNTYWNCVSDDGIEKEMQGNYLKYQVGETIDE